MGVELQTGGADQWGNITAGLELIRRRAGARDGDEAVHGLSYPLLTLPSGEKFGKTAEGTSVWLDPEATSPYAFYQYWLNAADADVGQYLRFFTLFDRERIEALEAEHAVRPEVRPAQRALALDLTIRTHGEAAARLAVTASEAAFSRDPIRDPAVLEALWRDGDGFTTAPGDADRGAAAFLASTGSVGSNSEARRLIAAGGVTLNDEAPGAHDAPVPAAIAGEWYVIRLGKRRVRVGRLVR
jgi:tyrosyl-tRNA synthetase